MSPNQSTMEQRVAAAAAAAAGGGGAVGATSGVNHGTAASTTTAYSCCPLAQVGAQCTTTTTTTTSDSATQAAADGQANNQHFTHAAEPHMRWVLQALRALDQRMDLLFHELNTEKKHRHTLQQALQTQQTQHAHMLQTLQTLQQQQLPAAAAAASTVAASQTTLHQPQRTPAAAAAATTTTTPNTTAGNAAAAAAAAATADAHTNLLQEHQTHIETLYARQQQVVAAIHQCKELAEQAQQQATRALQTVAGAAAAVGTQTPAYLQTLATPLQANAPTVVTVVAGQQQQEQQQQQQQPRLAMRYSLPTLLDLAPETEEQPGDQLTRAIPTRTGQALRKRLETNPALQAISSARHPSKLSHRYLVERSTEDGEGIITRLRRAAGGFGTGAPATAMQLQQQHQHHHTTKNRGGAGGHRGSGGGRRHRSRSRGRAHGGGHKGHRGGGGGGKDGVPYGGKSLIVGPVVPLTKSDNAWQPHTATEQDAAAAKQAKAEAAAAQAAGNQATAEAAAQAAAQAELRVRVETARRNAKSLLNKLAQSNYDRLGAQIMEIFKSNVDEGDETGAIQSSLVDTVFTKAVMEVRFCPMYARLCQQVHETLGGQKFRALLLSHCQAQFSKVLEQQQQASNGNGSSATMTTAATSDEHRTDAERLEKEFKRKRLMLGNITFMSELFKLGLLPGVIMHMCAEALHFSNLEDATEDEADCLLRLLTTAGPLLDGSTAENKRWLNVYCEALSGALSRSKAGGDGQSQKKLPSRVRFAIMDFLELRKRHWQGRDPKGAGTPGKGSSGSHARPL